MRTDFLPKLQMVFDPVTAGLIIGGVGSIGKYIFGSSQKKAAMENPYQNNPWAKQQLGLAQSLYNARMAGANIAEQNIAKAQANQLDTIERNATDSGQALALATGTQGTANDAYTDLAMKEAMDKEKRAALLDNAYGRMSEMFMNDEKRRAELLAAGSKNKAGAVGDIAEGLVSYGTYLNGNKK